MPANPLEPYTLHVTRLRSSVIIGLKFRLPDKKEVANGMYAKVTEDSRELQAERGDGFDPRDPSRGKGCKITAPTAFTHRLMLMRECLNYKPGEEDCEDERRKSDQNRTFQIGIGRIVVATDARRRTDCQRKPAAIRNGASVEARERIRREAL